MRLGGRLDRSVENASSVPVWWYLHFLPEFVSRAFSRSTP